MDLSNRAVKWSLLVSAVLLLALSCLAAQAGTKIPALKLQMDSNFAPGQDYNAATGTYTFYYSIWGTVSDWKALNGGVIDYVDLGVCPWGKYDTFTRYQPGRYDTAKYPKFSSASQDYWSAYKATWSDPDGDLGGATSYPYTWGVPGKNKNAYRDGYTKSGTWDHMQMVSATNYPSTNLDSVDGNDAYQGLDGNGTPIFLGGFSFNATHVATGMVPYVIWDSGHNNILGQGEVIGPTPELSTMLLLGVTGLPFITNRLRRRRREETEA